MDSTKSAFPHPPKLVDILRMEPELPFSAAILRASDMNGDCSGAHSRTEDITNACTSPRQFRMVVEDSPIFLPHHTYRGSALKENSTLSREHDLTETPSKEVECSPNVTLEEAGFAALAGWLSDYLYVLITRNNHFASRSARSQAQARSQAADHIYDIILAARLQSSTVFLALWYIGQLPDGLVAAAGVTKGYTAVLDMEEMIIRTFVVGSMLANKWLSDSTLSAKHWHQVSFLPLGVVNDLEFSALFAFKFNLFLTPRDWHTWLSKLDTYHTALSSQHFGQDTEVLHILVSKAILGNLSALRDNAQLHLSRGKRIVLGEPVIHNVRREAQYNAAQAHERTVSCGVQRSHSPYPFGQATAPSRYSPYRIPADSKAERTAHRKAFFPRSLDFVTDLWARGGKEWAPSSRIDVG